MKLTKVRVQNYRAIVDSGVVDLDERVTVLIGKNEQGKTTFLKGLNSASPKVSYAPSDLPNHKRAELEQKKPSEIPIVTLWLSVESAELPILQRAISAGQSTKIIKITKYFDNHSDIFVETGDGKSLPAKFSKPSFTTQENKLKAEAASLRAKLEAHAARHGEFQPNLAQALNHVDQFSKSTFDTIEHIDNLIKTLSASLTSVPGQDSAIQEDIAKYTKIFDQALADAKQVAQQDPRIEFEKLLPGFAFHSTTLDMIPNEVSIKDFVNDPDGISRGMANLCRVASLSAQQIGQLASSADTSMRESYEDFYKGKVSGGINEFWTQQTYHVHFRFEQDKMSVSISDDTYSPRIAPRDRSDGFQWYLSFYAAMINEVSNARPVVFLLDNPGLELHADGQRDIKRFLEEKLPANAQVIYVTHSGAMIDPFKLDQVRRVELKPNMEGTKIVPLAFKGADDLDLLEPVRSAIGASLAASLIFNEYNLLVEGAADKPILEGALTVSRDELTKKIVVNGSVAETPEGFLVRFYQRAKLPYLVYLDADSAGRDIERRLLGWEIPSNNILKLNEMFDRSGNDYELEDIISVATYHEAVLSAYPERPVEAPDSSYNGKLTKYYEKQFDDVYKIGFNKRRVAEQLKQMLVAGKADNQTLEALRHVVNSIKARLSGQALPERLKREIQVFNPTRDAVVEEEAIALPDAEEG